MSNRIFSTPLLVPKLLLIVLVCITASACELNRNTVLKIRKHQIKVWTQSKLQNNLKYTVLEYISLPLSAKIFKKNICRAAKVEEAHLSRQIKIDSPADEGKGRECSCTSSAPSKDPHIRADADGGETVRTRGVAQGRGTRESGTSYNGFTVKNGKGSLR